MSADRLREAARVLREKAEAAPPGPWDTQAGTDGDPADGPTTYTLTAPSGDIATGEYDRHDGRALDYARSMHPGVGLALADWLDTAGADLWAHGPLCECGSSCLACDDDLSQPHVRRALAVADLILGGAA